MTALHEVQQRGTSVLVATGRRPRSAAEGLAREGLRPPAVFLDGAVGHHLATGERFHQAAFPADDAAAVVAVFEQAGVSPCVYVDRPDADVVVGRNPATRPEHLASIGRWLAREELSAVVDSEPVLAIGVVGYDGDALRAIAAQIAGVAEASVVRDIFFGDATLVARPRGISKWQGVLSYCERAGCDPERVLAIGDGENDIELLTAAKVACVVSDGCDAALALADHVFEPASAGGWSAVVDLL